MLTLRSGVYKESDLYYITNLIDRGECKLYGHAVCAFCDSKRACEDVKRLKAHIEKLLNEHSFLEK